MPPAHVPYVCRGPSGSGGQAAESIFSVAMRNTVAPYGGPYAVLRSIRDSDSERSYGVQDLPKHGVPHMSAHIGAC